MMRKMCAASAAIVMCLELGGLPVVAQEAVSPASAWPATTANPADTPAQVTVEVAALVGMKSLEIIWGVADGLTGANWIPFGARIPIDTSPFTLPPATVTVKPSERVLVVFAGRPPCWVGYYRSVAPCLAPVTPARMHPNTHASPGSTLGRARTSTCGWTGCQPMEYANRRSMALGPAVVAR